MYSLLKSFAFIVLLFSYCITLNAQWSSDPAVNLQVCDVTGDQALPKIASTSDGGFYISWFDHRSTSYAVYLQRLDAMGNKLWNTDGLLISDNPQNSSLVDWSIASDNQDNAILTFTDTRDNDSLHAFAYLIDPSGNFLWGNNGIRLSGDGDYQPNPVTTQTSDGNYVFTWIVATTPQKIAMQKISFAGQKMWGANPIIYESGTTENYTYPAIVPSDNGSVIVEHSGYTGGFTAPYKIYAQKFDTNGNPVWGTGGVSIQNTGIPFYEHPLVISDNNNGAFISWYDDRDNNSFFSAFVQHVTSSGTVLFPANGSEVSTTATMHHLYPTMAYLSNTDELFCFWIEEPSLQNQFAVYGQKFDAAGTRQWAASGIAFTTMTSNTIFGPYALPTDTSAYVIYLQGNASGLNQGINAFMVNSNGDFSWSPNFVDMSDPTNQKLHSVTTISTDHVAKIAWEDTRNDGGGIYAQNINPDGSLGYQIVPVELTSFSATVNEENVILNWNTATETNNSGFNIERRSNESEWKDIGFVPGFGTSSESHSYSFIDANLSAGSFAYRLKQINFDGSFEYSNEVEDNVTNPAEYLLAQNYPNPFNPSTVIDFSIPVDGLVNLTVYNSLGEEVAVLVNNILPAGSHSVNFDASKLTSGIYIVRMTSGNFTDMIKMNFIK